MPGIAADDDHHAAVMPARAPEIIIIVPADGGRQAQAAAEYIDRRSLSIIASEEDRMRTIRRWQRPIYGRDFSGHLLPTEHVRIILRQHAERLMFARRG